MFRQRPAVPSSAAQTNPAGTARPGPGFGVGIVKKAKRGGETGSGGHRESPVHNPGARLEGWRGEKPLLVPPRAAQLINVMLMEQLGKKGQVRVSQMAPSTLQGGTGVFQPPPKRRGMNYGQALLSQPAETPPKVFTS